MPTSRCSVAPPERLPPPSGRVPRWSASRSRPKRSTASQIAPCRSSSLASDGSSAVSTSSDEHGIVRAHRRPVKPPDLSARRKACTKPGSIVISVPETEKGDASNSAAASIDASSPSWLSCTSLVRSVPKSMAMSVRGASALNMVCPPVSLGPFVLRAAHGCPCTARHVFRFQPTGSLRSDRLGGGVVEPRRVVGQLVGDVIALAIAGGDQLVELGGGDRTGR